MGFNEKVISWLQSYLLGRTQTVQVGMEVSEVIELEFGTPQGYCITYLIYILYTSDAELWVHEGILETLCLTVVAESVSELQRKLEDQGLKVL